MTYVIFPVAGFIDKSDYFLKSGKNYGKTDSVVLYSITVHYICERNLSMNKFTVSSDIVILCEDSAFEGVKRVAAAVSEDISLVVGSKPEKVSAVTSAENVIIIATLGKSEILDRLIADGRIDISNIENKREVYGVFQLEAPVDGIKNAIIVVGSDKRGTIYGAFSISEACGISPLVYWGDATPAPKNEVALDYSTPYISKEPSVKYRGFFINDEWPAFGGWCRDRFGGFNTGAYDKVFQLLLRLKGNYMWPAMWSSSFSDDGPGIANAELADIYGVIMGASHHEPMCRAGVEWQQIYKKYGDSNEWSFIANRDAITEFWRDGVKRNKDFENIITVGMRGENDSLLLGADATLEDNINVLRDAITTQNNLIKEVVNPDLNEVPRMLAMYNEVEDFYYAPNGLKDWEGLDNVILMLCDDNFANLRYLPTEADRDHKGGFGMYYHYDYHGSSISYEWINSNRLTKTWEQMTMAYEYGIRDLWIVNLGDIKGLEYPICYFLDLAYDFDRYGSNALNSTEEYVKSWIAKQYSGWLDENQLADVYTLINGYTKLNNLRTPESMNSKVYSPVNFREGERIHAECQELINLAGKIYNDAPEGCKASVFTMVYYPTVASLNLVQMHIEAGLNHYYASRGSLAANKYLDCVKKRSAIDYELKAQFDSILDGKWIHMMDSWHTGFNCWCAEDWSYPVVSEVTPVPCTKAYISFAGYEKYSIGRFWHKSRPLYNREFMRPDTESITINIESGSSIDMQYFIYCDNAWLEIDKSNGTLTPDDGMAQVNIKCNRKLLSGTETATVRVECRFCGDETAKATLYVTATDNEYDYAPMTFVDTEGYVSFDADRYATKHDTDACQWMAIDHLSRLDRPALKVLPSTASLLNKDDTFATDDVPYVEYNFATEAAGEWECELWLSCRNPVAKDAKLRTALSINGGDVKVLNTVNDNYKARNCDAWNREILDVRRIAKTNIAVEAGVNTLRIYGGDPNIILQKVVAYPKGKPVGYTYTGPRESYYTK